VSPAVSIAGIDAWERLEACQLTRATMFDFPNLCDLLSADGGWHCMTDWVPSVRLCKETP